MRLTVSTSDFVTNETLLIMNRVESIKKEFGVDVTEVKCPLTGRTHLASRPVEVITVPKLEPCFKKWEECLQAVNLLSYKEMMEVRELIISFKDRPQEE